MRFKNLDGKLWRPGVDETDLVAKISGWHEFARTVQMIHDQISPHLGFVVLGKSLMGRAGFRRVVTRADEYHLLVISN